MGMSQGSGPANAYISGSIYPDTVRAYEIETGMNNADGMPLRARNQGHWIMDDRSQNVDGVTKTYKGTRDVMAKALRDGSLLTNITLQTLARYGWDITLLPNNPPNPFPTPKTMYHGDFQCGLFHDDGEPGDKPDARILNQSGSLHLL